MSRRLHRVSVWFLCLALTTLGMSLIAGWVALAQDGRIRVVLNGSPVTFSTPPIVIDDQLFLPLRELFGSLGAEVAWIAESASIVACRGEIVVALRVDSNTASINGTVVSLTASPRLIKGKVMVPLRAVATAFGADVAYADHTALISLNPPENSTTLPKRYYETIDECIRDAYKDKWIWAKCFHGPTEVYADKTMQPDKTVTIKHLERLRLLAIHLPEPDEKRSWLDPADTRLVEFRNEKGQTGWTTITDYLRLCGFDYKNALEERFFLEDPRKGHKWSGEIWKLIETNHIRIGMIPDMVRLSWGPPRKVNRSIYTFGVHEQWIYGDFGPYVYFEDGRLTAIQD